MSILHQFLAYFEHLVVVVFVGLLVGFGVVCWLLSALLGGCWVRFGGSRGGGAQGGLKRLDGGGGMLELCGVISVYVGVILGILRVARG